MPTENFKEQARFLLKNTTHTYKVVTETLKYKTYIYTYIRT